MQDSTIDAVDRYLTGRYRELPVDRQRLLWEHMVYIANNKDRMLKWTPKFVPAAKVVVDDACS